MSGDDVLMRWRSVLRSCLGRSAARHFSTLYTNLTAVDWSIKAAYLVDCCSVQSPSLLQLVKELSDESLLLNQLRVVDIEDTLFVINQSALSKLAEQSAARPIVIDVSSALSHAEIMNQSEQVLDSCRNVIRRIVSDNNQLKVMRVDMCDSINRTTLFGLILGYPALYWYSDHTDPAQCTNCLDCVPLIVNKLTITSETDQSECSKEKEGIHIGVDPYAVVGNSTTSLKDYSDSTSNSNGLTKLKDCLTRTTRCTTSTNSTKDSVQRAMIYSFTYPADLQSVCAGVVDEWVKAVQATAEQQQQQRGCATRISLRLSTETVSLSVVPM